MSLWCLELRRWRLCRWGGVWDNFWVEKVEFSVECCVEVAECWVNVMEFGVHSWFESVDFGVEDWVEGVEFVVDAWVERLEDCVEVVKIGVDGWFEGVEFGVED